MEISSKNNICFKSTPIHTVNLKKVSNGVEDGFVKAVFSKLDPRDPEDVNAIKKIKETWHDKLATDWICESFEKLNKVDKFALRFHCIELPGNESLDKRIIGLTESFVPPDEDFKFYHLSCIASKAENQYGKTERTVKNIGEVMLGSLFNDAKKLKASCFEIISACNGFYEKTFADSKIAFKEKYCVYNIQKRSFNKYLKHIQNKFNFKFSQK